MISTDQWVPLAEVARPHGVQGELRLKLFNRDSDILLEQDEVLVRLPDGEEQEASVTRARRADQAILLKLYSVDDRDRAEELRGALICARRGAFPEPEPGEFYVCDIIGATVVVPRPAGPFPPPPRRSEATDSPAASTADSPDSPAEAAPSEEPPALSAPRDEAAGPAPVEGELMELGKVRELRSYPSVDALVIAAADGGRDWEVPLVAAFVQEVDAIGGTVTLVSTEGLDR